MADSSTGHYIFLRTSIFGLQAIAPCCIGYIIFRAFGLVPRAYRVPTLVELYFVLEFLFFFCIYLPRKRHLQKEAIHPSHATRAERKILFEKCHQQISDPEAYLSKWFMHAPMATIKRENVRQFLCWAFLNGVEPTCQEDEDELESYVAATEHMLRRKLEPGFNDKVECLRLTLDPVNMGPRSLTWYIMVLIVDLTTSLRLRLVGFHLHATAQWFHIFPPRPQTLLCPKDSISPAKNMSYWLRPHKSTTKLPVVFLHGIGIGLWPYIPFLADLAKGEDGDVGILAIEIMPISIRICHMALESGELCHQVEQIVDHHNFNKFVLMSHSYGTVISTQLLKSLSFARRIDSLVLCDPISFLLHLPNVAYNFVRRKPTSAKEWLLHYFAAQDMGISHTLGRTFFWNENILWKEDLASVRKSVVVVSKHDLLVDVEESWRYLTEEVDRTHDEMSRTKKGEITDYFHTGENAPTTWASKDESLSVICFDDINHGEMFNEKRRWRCVLKVLSGFVKGE